jgi:hypothetical protein
MYKSAVHTLCRQFISRYNQHNISKQGDCLGQQQRMGICSNAYALGHVLLHTLYCLPSLPADTACMFRLHVYMHNHVLPAA